MNTTLLGNNIMSKEWDPYFCGNDFYKGSVLEKGFTEDGPIPRLVFLGYNLVSWEPSKMVEVTKFLLDALDNDILAYAKAPIFFMLLFNRLFIHETPKEKGVVYIGVDDNFNGYYKIGKSRDPSCKTRVSKTINPNYRILYVTDVIDEPLKVEKEIHDKLKEHKFEKNGCKEWFKLEDYTLKSILNEYSFHKLEQ